MAKLFSPFKLKDLNIKNRIVMAPMCMDYSDRTGYANEWHYVHYVTRAIGGVGLIILEATVVEPNGDITGKDLGIWEDGHIAYLKKIVEECHKYDALVGIQLNHSGRKAQDTVHPILAPSPIPLNENFRTPKEMTHKDIEEVKMFFKSAARRCFAAGFDMIEILGGHGYLINQFLSPLTNMRSDEYGGTAQKRVRFLREIIKAIREEWPNSRPLGLRVSAEEYAKGGNSIEEVSEIINLIKNEHIDIINVSSGGVVYTNINIYPGYQIKFSEEVKRNCIIPTIGGGLITSPLMAEEIVSNNRADLVYLGRELLKNPYWPLQAAAELKVDLKWPDPYERSKMFAHGCF